MNAPDSVAAAVPDTRLLLVDDDPAAILVLSRMLSHYDDQRFATSGEDAIRVARESRPDLILLDVDMPRMSGFEVCDALKADAALQGIPVIFVTSHAAAQMEAAALGRGAADFVTKPLVASQVAARVRARLRASRLVEGSRLDLADRLPLPLPRPDSPAPRLLVVEDDETAVGLLRNTLADMGDFHVAKTGEQALEQVRRLDPDLVLLDAHVPGLNALEVCALLSGDTRFRHVPIVFMTRFPDPRIESRALDLGAADFVAKPYRPSVVQARVRNLLGSKRRVDERLATVREHWQRIGEARVADIVGAASDAIVTSDAEHRIVLINAAACRLFRTRPEQAIGRPLQSLLGPGSGAAEPPTKDPVRLDVRRSDGGLLSLEISVSHSGEGAGRLVTSMLRDISDRVQLEAESRARIEAEATSRAKSLMLSYIAHEMGNPLNSLMGFAQLMKADAEHPLSPRQASHLEHIVASCGHLQILMRDVMDVGRFESGMLGVDLRPINATATVEASVESVRALAAQADVRVLNEGESRSTQVVADAGRLHQCLANLLSNAIKYNRRGGCIRVALRVDQGMVVLSISDDGLGMTEHQRRHLFEPFNRLGRGGETAPGAGLGLVITRHLVEAMNGRLQVDSEPGVGSCFRILLPRHGAGDWPQDGAGQVDKAR